MFISRQTAAPKWRASLSRRFSFWRSWRASNTWWVHCTLCFEVFVFCGGYAVYSVHCVHNTHVAVISIFVFWWLCLEMALESAVTQHMYPQSSPLSAMKMIAKILFVNFLYSKNIWGRKLALLQTKKVSRTFNTNVCFWRSLPACDAS